MMTNIVLILCDYLSLFLKRISKIAGLCSILAQIEAFFTNPIQCSFKRIYHKVNLFKNCVKVISLNESNSFVKLQEKAYVRKSEEESKCQKACFTLFA